MASALSRASAYRLVVQKRKSQNRGLLHILRGSYFILLQVDVLL